MRATPAGDQSQPGAVMPKVSLRPADAGMASQREIESAAEAGAFYRGHKRNRRALDGVQRRLPAVGEPVGSRPIEHGNHRQVGAGRKAARITRQDEAASLWIPCARGGDLLQQFQRQPVQTIG